MFLFKCKMCGGDIHAEQGVTHGTCDSCGTASTLPKTTDEKLVNLFNRANHQRQHNDFDKALANYENILNEDNTNAEAHWCIVLCRYGIEYVEDPHTRERIPTCHRVQHEPILSDDDYLSALENASDSYARELYETEAKRINEIQKGILTISNKEEPYDIFICYKETTDGGSRTQDSALAHDIYYNLQKSYRIFFARITLEGKLGQQYEPYIFSALNSAKVMLVLGTKTEYFNAVWVKNEWSRFLAMMKYDKSKLLIPCYRDMDAYDLPEELSVYQSLDMNKIGFIQDLTHSIKKTLEVNKPATTLSVAGTTSTESGIESFLNRGFLFLDASDWTRADECFNKAINIEPECASAHIGKLCVELKIKNEDALINHIKPLENITNYQKALRFSDSLDKEKLEEINKAIKERIAENEQKEQQRLTESKQQVIAIRKQISKYQGFISAGNRHSIALKSDSTVIVVGDREDGTGNTPKWRDIIAVSTGAFHTIGLKSDGTVAVAGRNKEGQCKPLKWRDIIAIDAGGAHNIGLKRDGTVVAAAHKLGSNDYGQCNTQDWRDIIAISARRHLTVGLKANGTVLATGSNENGQRNVSSWQNIVAVEAGGLHTIGLHEDGTIIAIGSNEFGQCNIHNWNNIVEIAAGGSHTIGLKADGTCVAVGKNLHGQCNVSEWQNIVAIAAGGSFSIGLTAEGMVVSVGNNEWGQCNTHNWRSIGSV